MFNIRTRNATDDLDFILYELQSEEKGHATPYIENSREGRITDYSLNNNHADIQLSNTLNGQKQVCKDMVRTSLTEWMIL